MKLSWKNYLQVCHKIYNNIKAVNKMLNSIKDKVEFMIEITSN